MIDKLRKFENVCIERIFYELKVFLLKGVRCVAFTMAEILLSLTIIGVVAAITLPSLTGNINERTWNTQRKALYARLSQAVSLMPQVRGYGNFTITPVEGNEGYVSYSSDNATDVFLSNGLAKVFKLNNICDSDNLSDCGIPDQVIIYGGASKIALTGDAMKTIGDLNANYSSVGCNNTVYVHSLVGAFETANGESVLVHYNPACKGNWEHGTRVMGEAYVKVTPEMLTCANFVYDLNGKKGPNTMGKDMGFMTLLYDSDSAVVAPVFVNGSIKSDLNWQGANQHCKSFGDDIRLPNNEELASLLINEKFLPSEVGIKYYWSGTKVGSGKAWHGEFGHNGVLAHNFLSDTSSVLCVKR